MLRLLPPVRYRCGPQAEPGRRATWLELFFDLAFVAAVAHVGAPLAVEYTLAGLGRYAFLFLLIWWAWIGHTSFSTRFDTDDVLQRGLTLAQIFLVAVMAVNAKEALDTRASAGFAAAYAAMRFVLVLQYWRTRAIEPSRLFVRAHTLGFGIAAACWLASSLLPVPARFWMWGAALLIDLGTPCAANHLVLRTPPDAEHLPERFGLFTIILLGESLVAVMKGMESQEHWSAAAAALAFLGLAAAFIVWWWYFDGARAAAARTVQTAGDARRFLVWTMAHLPLYLGIGVAGVGLEHLIRLAPDEHPHVAEIRILCGAAAVLMTALAAIAAVSNRDAAARRETAGMWVWPLALAPLGVAELHLPSVALAATLTALLAIQLGLSVRRPAREGALHGAPAAV